MKSIERWGVFELEFYGAKDGNPFTDFEIKGLFAGAHEWVELDGFYDGDGKYKIRFMPSFEGEYRYTVWGNFSSSKYEGAFMVTPPSEGNHGAVRVANQYHFAYDDGTPYYSIGTTCYAWTHQSEEMQQKTLETLKNSPFNKLRFCVFPKHYDYNLYEPISNPYEGTPCGIENLNRENFMEYKPDNPENKWDFKRFNTEHFRTLEKRVDDLMKLGIQADIILFHPYDRWGFSVMGRENDLFYVRYVIARLAAYRNVWWSLANEYDLCAGKSAADWECIAQEIVANDPYTRLRSIHNCKQIYDFSRPWVTHCSIQRTEIYLSAANAKMWRERYQKPVVLDEVGYEGDINWSWGNLTAQEMVRLFWTAAVRGAYCGHGETYVKPDNKLWWSHGGTLYGESAPRLAFLHDILCQTPGLGLEPANLPRFEDNAATASHPAYKGKYYLVYTNRTRPSFREFEFLPNVWYDVEVIDTWSMTIHYVGKFKGKFKIELPAREFMAIRIKEVQNA